MPIKFRNIQHMENTQKACVDAGLKEIPDGIAENLPVTYYEIRWLRDLDIDLTNATKVACGLKVIRQSFEFGVKFTCDLAHSTKQTNMNELWQLSMNSPGREIYVMRHSPFPRYS